MTRDDRPRNTIAASLTALAGLVVAGFAPAQSARAADAPPAMIIFDGSGSMWGKIEGDKRPKFEVAREALSDGLAKVPTSASYGLASFGHRRTGDCSDVQILAPIAAGDASRVIAPLDKLNPKGKGPIAGAIRDVAKAFPSGAAGSVVLIHDSTDNCRQDPCEAIAEVHAMNPKLRFHLVSIALEPADREKMACIPAKTGGKIFDATDAEALTLAVDAAVRLALIDPSGAPVAEAAAADSKPADTIATKTAPVPAPPSEPGLQLSARLGRDATALDAPIRWVVRRGEVIVFETIAATPFVKLEPGSYAIEATASLTTARANANVSGSTATTVMVPLDAAAVTIAVRDLKDGPVSQSAMVSVTKADDMSAARRPVWVGRASEAGLILPAGGYRVTVTDGMITREQMVSATAGSVLMPAIVTGAGRLEVTTVAKADGPPLDGVTILLARDDPDAVDGRREIARSAATAATFVLPAGTYYVTARSGAAAVRERIAVGAGDTVKRALVLGLATVQVIPSGAFAKAVSSNGAGAGKVGLKTRVFALDSQPPREVARSAALTPEFQLAPGRYRVDASAGGLNVKAQQEFDLEAGASRKLALKLDAQTVQLKVSGGGEVSWEVRDQVGGIVARTMETSPALVLVPGAYQVSAVSRDRTATGAFQVPAVADAQVLTVEIGFR